MTSVRQNETMRMLAAWAAIIAVPTLIAGIYGMNFSHLPGAESHVGFHGLIAFMVVVCGLLYLQFKRVKWL
jgi:magnesium transporter